MRTKLTSQAFLHSEQNDHVARYLRQEMAKSQVLTYDIRYEFSLNREK